jgi:hypothetical protein
MVFHVGQKVVCVDADDTSAHGRKELSEGSVYTVRWVGQNDRKHPARPELSNTVGVRLIEIPIRSHGDNPFSALRFRPLVSKSTETGMAILREILDRENVDDKVSDVIEIVFK